MSAVVPGQVEKNFTTRLMREEIRQEILREMEAKAREEREEQAAREAERQLEELQEKIKTSESSQIKVLDESYPVIRPLLQQLIVGGHNVLLVFMRNGWITGRDHSNEHSAIIITNKAVYMLCYFADKKICTNLLSPIYSFDYPLNLKQTRLIANMALVDLKPAPEHPRILSRPKQFEAVIRYIPGSYINGPWKQLDGFFGTYINEVTMELSTIPPPLF